MPRPLTGSEFKATLTDKMHDVTQTVANVLDIWPYVESVPVADLEGHAIYEHFVEVVYRSDDGYYDHVLAMTRTTNFYLSAVVDLANDSSHVHRLIDLNREYGLP